MNSTKFSLSAIVLASALCGSAYAGQGVGGGGDGMKSAPAAGAMNDGAYNKALDTNKDGVVSPDEQRAHGNKTTGKGSKHEQMKDSNRSTGATGSTPTEGTQGTVPATGVEGVPATTPRQ